MDESRWIEAYIRPLVHSLGADELRDDVALLTPATPLIVSMDTLVEGRHFLPADPLLTVGEKLICVNVSDIHAKGALPCEALLSIAWPQAGTEAAFADLMQGVERGLNRFEVSLIGGDLVETPGPLTLTLTLTGQCLGSKPVRRSNAKPGQGLYIDGEIGWGGLGLAAAKQGADTLAAARYRVPEISTGQAAEQVAHWATASLDVSDGLVLDVSRLAEASGCGYELDLGAIPLAQPSSEIALILDQCVAGDDYRILIAAPAGISIPGFTEIGKVTQSLGGRMKYGEDEIKRPVTLGYQHGQ